MTSYYHTLKVFVDSVASQLRSLPHQLMINTGSRQEEGRGEKVALETSKVQEEHEEESEKDGQGQKGKREKREDDTP